CFPISLFVFFYFFFSSRRRHTRFDCDWSSDVCSSDLLDSRNGQLACGGFCSPRKLSPSMRRIPLHFISVAGIQIRVSLDKGLSLRPCFKNIFAGLPAGRGENEVGRGSCRAEAQEAACPNEARQEPR